MIGRFIAPAILALLLLLPTAGAEAAVTSLQGTTQSAAADQHAMRDGGDTCDGSATVGSHCSLSCIAAAAIVGEPFASPAAGRASYGSLPPVATTAAMPEPDHSPPR